MGRASRKNLGQLSVAVVLTIATVELLEHPEVATAWLPAPAQAFPGFIRRDRTDTRVVDVMIMRRSQEDLSEEEFAALSAKFPRCKLRFHSASPSNYLEHAALCDRLQVDAVILPMEQPIPTLAMERGVPHIAFVNDEWSEQLPLKPEFKEFVPK